MAATSYSATKAAGMPTKGTDGKVLDAETGTTSAPSGAPDIATAGSGEFRCDGQTMLDVYVSCAGGTCTLKKWSYSDHTADWFVDEDWGAGGSRAFASGDKIKIPHPCSSDDAGAFQVTAISGATVNVWVLASEE